eukprot:5981072-Pyramimonas_sp.AAC.1
MVETHAGCHSSAQWTRKSRSMRWTYLDNAARSTGRGTSAAGVAKANEGGEVLLAPGHRNVHRLYGKTYEAAAFCADGSSSFD